MANVTIRGLNKKYENGFHAVKDVNLEIRDGRMHLSDRPGLGVTLSDQAREWTVEKVTVDKPR